MSDRPVEDAIIKKQSEGQLWNVFNDLTTTQKIAIGDTFLEGKKLHQIGKTLGISGEGVRGSKNRGLRIIRRKLNKRDITRSDF